MQIVRMSLDEWNANRDTLAEFFEIDWKHARMEKELSKAADISSKRSEAAKQKHSNWSANAEQKHTPSPSQSPSQVKKDINQFEVKQVKFPRHGATSTDNLGRP